MPRSTPAPSPACQRAAVRGKPQEGVRRALVPYPKVARTSPCGFFPSRALHRRGADHVRPRLGLVAGVQRALGPWPVLVCSRPEGVPVLGVVVVVVVRPDGAWVRRWVAQALGVGDLLGVGVPLAVLVGCPEV